ncbi:MAG: hypothetical protein AAGI53_09000 [Planctomycetota bacterium]
MKATFCLSAVVALAGTANAQVSALAVLLEGQLIDGSEVTGVGGPKVNGNNEVGSLATLADGTRAITLDGVSIFNSGNVLSNALTGGETTIGIGNFGQFIYSPSVDGSDAVWGQDGLILIENTPAPDFDPSINSTFHSRPRMTDDGTAYWVSGFNDGAGGTSSVGRMLYKRDGFSGAITTVIRAGDIVDGVEVDDFGGIDFDYEFSSNNLNSILGFNDANTGSTANDTVLAVNGTIVAREASANGDGDNWDNFNDVSINNAGNYVFTGDTDGATTSDNFLAYNGSIVLREGDTVDGLALGVFDNVTINNNNEVAFITDGDDGVTDVETLFYAADGADLGSSVALLRVGDVVDLGVDGQWILDDFNAVNTGEIALGTDGFVSIEVDLESFDGLTNIEGIISVAVPAPGAAGALALAGLAAARRRRA